MNRFTLSLLALLISVPVFSSASPRLDNTFVGTGGEGVREGNKIFVRDLYEDGKHKNPWVGKKTDPTIAVELGTWNPLNLTKRQHQILLRKLTDANDHYPRLGSFLILALRFYDWHYTDLALMLPPNVETRVVVPHENRVAIANRYMQSISVNRATFKQLDDENKVALLLHEAFYSLVNLTEDGPHSSQSVATTRMLTSNLFSQDISSRDVLRSSASLLAIPELPYLERETPLCMQAILGMSVTDNLEKLTFVTKVLPEIYNEKKRNSGIQQIFRDALEERKKLSLPEVTEDSFRTTFFVPSSLAVRPHFYKSRTGDQTQVRIVQLEQQTLLFTGVHVYLTNFYLSFEKYFWGLNCR